MKTSLLLFLCVAGLQAQQSALDVLNNRPIVDAHNCYPEDQKYGDRLERALRAGYPVGVEQDIAWYVDPKTGQGRAVISHSKDPKGFEPTLSEYFFEPVRPVIEKALRDNDRSRWPLIVLHFDFKDNREPVLRAVWDVLAQYEPWLTTSVKGVDPAVIQPLNLRPILVLTEDNDEQERVFFSELQSGATMRLFGSAHTRGIEGNQTERAHLAATLDPAKLLTEKPTNYRRWWNNSWAEVEEGGQSKADDWTKADDQRLRALVGYAHKLGYWIRFYTLDGFAKDQNQGWSAGYNFGSIEAARKRWEAAARAGVNLIATDHYEELGQFLAGSALAAGGRR